MQRSLEQVRRSDSGRCSCNDLGVFDSALSRLAAVTPSKNWAAPGTTVIQITGAITGAGTPSTDAVDLKESVSLSLIVQYIAVQEERGSSDLRDTSVGIFRPWS